VLLGPFAGVCADRFNRRLIMILSETFIALCMVFLALLYAAGKMRIEHVYIVMLLRAIGGAFQYPAMQASTSLMVPHAQLPRVAGMNQTIWGAHNIITPALGAFLMSVMPLYGIMVIDVSTAALAVVPLLFITIPQPARRANVEGFIKRETSIWQDLHEGLLYVRHWPGLFWVCCTATLVSFLLAPAYSLMPLLVTNHFGGGAIQLGAISSAGGLGIVVGGLVLSVWGGFKRRLYTSLMGVIGMGMGTLLTGLAPAHAWGLAIASVFLARSMDPITNGPLIAAMQAKVAPEMQGRVLTLVGSLLGAAAPLGIIIAGPLADAVGIRFWYVLGGSMCIVLGVAAFFIPTVVHLEDQSSSYTRPHEGEATSPAETS
jgi:MFS transporter, DHA3 family, macrolide efflux protein